MTVVNTLFLEADNPYCSHWKIFPWGFMECLEKSLQWPVGMITGVVFLNLISATNFKEKMKGLSNV